jgi:hypothetical protein
MNQFSGVRKGSSRSRPGAPRQRPATHRPGQARIRNDAAAFRELNTQVHLRTWGEHEEWNHFCARFTVAAGGPVASGLLTILLIAPEPTVGTQPASVRRQVHHSQNGGLHMNTADAIAPRHPSWCSLAHCNAYPIRPRDREYHRSEPLVVSTEDPGVALFVHRGADRDGSEEYIEKAELDVPFDGPFYDEEPRVKVGINMSLSTADGLRRATQAALEMGTHP